MGTSVNTNDDDEMYIVRRVAAATTRRATATTRSPAPLMFLARPPREWSDDGAGAGVSAMVGAQAAAG